MKFSARTMGIIQILISAACFGFLGFFGKKAFAKNVTPFELLSLRFLVSGSMMLFAIGLLSKRLRTLNIKQILICFGLGICGYAVFSSFYFLAVRGLSMSLAVLLLYTFPMMVAMGAWFLLKDPIPKAKILVLPLCFIGTTFLIWGDFKIENMTSFLFGIGAAVAYAAYVLGSGKWLQSIDTLVASATIQLSAGIALFILGYRDLQHALVIFDTARSEIFGLAILCSILPISLFQLGLRHVKTWEASLFSTLEPITAILVGVLILGEGFTALQVVGTAIVFASLIWVAWPSKIGYDRTTQI